MAQGFSLADQLFNADTVAHLGGLFRNAGVFDDAAFQKQVMTALPSLELKARINLIADVLSDFLPGDFDAATDAIRQALPPPLDPGLSDDDFGHFIYAPLGVYVEKQGLEDHLSTSLSLLEDLTQRFSMEFSIRAFLNRWPEETLAQMHHWTEHEHYHVRRLASEGTRPKLPWGQSIGLTSAQTLPILDRLQADPTRFVTRSVANHLNDITKTDPDAVIARLKTWKMIGGQHTKELAWMARHALRGLIKAGHDGAMQHLGYDPSVDVQLTGLAISPDALVIGEAAEVQATLHAEEDAPLIVDYVIDFVKANGRTAPKVFKLKTCHMKAHEVLTLRKRHIFKKGATTFTHYPGLHRLHLQVNGRVVASTDFVLS